MIPLLHRTRVTGSIVGCTIASDSDKIFMIDNLFHFYELDTEDLSFTKSIQLLKDAKGRHKFTRSLSTSTQGYLFISPSKSSTGVVLRDNKTVIKIASLKWHKASFDFVFRADITGVYANAIDKGRGGKRELVAKMNVGNERNRDLFAQLF